MRKKPYTQIGIRRLKCFRCGDKAQEQWQICADNNVYRPICLKCDIELNEMVLKRMGFSDWEEKLEKYKKSNNFKEEFIK
jgi:hypothetical protein